MEPIELTFETLAALIQQAKAMKAQTDGKNQLAKRLDKFMDAAASLGGLLFVQETKG
jgi:hypothetical protein